MKSITVNEEITLSIPDSFAEMSREELSRLFGNEDPDRQGARDAENHVTLVAAWKQYPALLARLADLKTLAKRNEQLNRQGYEGHSYRFLDFFSAGAGKTRMEGYRFSFEVGGVKQTAETALVKNGKLIYSITCVGREENGERDHEAFRSVLSGTEIL